MINKVVSDYQARIFFEGVGEVERRLQVTPEIAGWEHLYFRTYTYRTGMVIKGESASEEMVMVLLSGSVTMEVEGRRWVLDGRRSVFTGKPHVIYLPPGKDYKMSVLADSDCAYSRASASGQLPARLIVPEELAVETVGVGAYEYQVTHLLKPGDAEKLVCDEMHTPGGRWADCPSHRHLDVDGGAVNAVSYYRFHPTNGWAIQRLHLPEQGQDEVVLVQHGDAVLVRQTGHPVAAAPGASMYTLNFRASEHPSDQVELVPDPVVEIH